MPELTLETLQLFAVFVVPGFVARQVYELLIPGSRSSLADGILEAITFSMFNLGLTWWAVRILARPGFADSRPVVFALGAVGVLVVTPSLLAVGAYKVRTLPLARRWVVDPAPSGWDYFFLKRRTCFILCHLKKGEKVAGYFGLHSFAAAYPAEPTLFMEQVWRLDGALRFVEPIAGSGGCIIKQGDCDLIEIFEAKEKP